MAVTHLPGAEDRSHPVRGQTQSPPFQNLSDRLLTRMVVVHRAHGFRFVIYTVDHEPAHIHLTGPGQAKINLLGPSGVPHAVYSIGIKRSTMRRLMAEVTERQTLLLEEWERIHGSSER